MSDTATETLSAIAVAQLTWKPGPSTAIAVAICRHMAETPGQTAWTDEITLPDLAPEDRNCIGIAWKRLTWLGLIERLEGATDHRRSTRPEQNGRTVWRYRIRSAALIREYLRRNQQPETITTQPLLGL